MNTTIVNGNDNFTAGRDLIVYHGEFTNDINVLVERSERMLYRYTRFMEMRDAVISKQNRDLSRYMPIAFLIAGALIGYASVQKWLPTVSLIFSAAFIFAGVVSNKTPSTYSQKLKQELNYYTGLANEQAEQINSIDLDIEFLKTRNENFDAFRSEAKNAGV